jgi:hypothetical protein
MLAERYTQCLKGRREEATTKIGVGWKTNQIMAHPSASWKLKAISTPLPGSCHTMSVSVAFAVSFKMPHAGVEAGIEMRSVK